MAAPRIRSDHDSLAQIAQNFQRQTDNSRKTLQQLKQNMDALQAGDWIGKGATAFYQEMNSAVLPAMQRLISALELAQRTTQQISQIMQTVENETALLFREDGTAGGAGGAGAAGGSGAGGASGGGASGSAGGSSGGASGGGAGAPASVNDVFKGDLSKSKAPSKITLPDTLNKGMGEAWKDSFPGGHEQEQGGILVRTKDGAYKWIRGKGTSGDNWSPNFGDIGDNELVGTGHTHPYDSGPTNVPFSSGDIDDFFRSDLGGKTSEEMMMVQSGDGQFVLARTAEFNKLVEGKSKTEIATLKAEMEKTYNDAVATAKSKGASFPERYDAAVKAVADKYHLLYYKGKDGTLVLQ